jgi:hypothetical protein
VPGSLTRWWVANPEYWTSSVETGQTWYILLGSNDAYWDGYWKHYSTNMNNLINVLVSRDITDIRLMHSPTNGSPALGQATLDTINSRLDWFRAVDHYICAVRAGVYCGPDLYTGLAHPDAFAADQLHLSAAGHAQVAAMIPAPATSVLLTLGLVGLSIVARFKRRKSRRR